MEITIPIRLISKDNEKIMNRNGRFFLSSKYKKFEVSIQFFFISQFPKFKPLEGDLSVMMTFYFKSKKHPDITNCPKSVCDALNGYLWKDDRQIKQEILKVVYGNEEKIEITCGGV